MSILQIIFHEDEYDPDIGHEVHRENELDKNLKDFGNTLDHNSLRYVIEIFDHTVSEMTVLEGFLLFIIDHHIDKFFRFLVTDVLG